MSAPVRRQRAGRLRSAVLEVRALDRDLAVPEREEIAAVDLDLLAIGRRAREGPLRDAAIARHEMPGMIERDVRDGGEDPREGLAHALAALVACTAHVRARGTLEDAIVSHEGHQGIDVVTVSAVLKERFQIRDRHHHLLAASTRESRSAPIAAPVTATHARDDLAGEMPSQFPIHLVTLGRAHVV